MTDLFADPVGLVLILWAIPGVLVALAFLSFGIDQVDHAAAGAYMFRPLLLPGILLLWPLVLWRWIFLLRHPGS
ncbi:hypothetical protein ACLE20_02590 [Rhizobium sp. YIM 134829]|uniref:hypothetical protein n=1 Tax=Rhizobium sp. YIM 134829 TaxID=3390453 RepID=UPI003979993D